MSARRPDKKKQPWEKKRGWHAQTEGNDRGRKLRVFTQKKTETASGKAWSTPLGPPYWNSPNKKGRICAVAQVIDTMGWWRQFMPRYWFSDELEEDPEDRGECSAVKD